MCASSLLSLSLPLVCLSLLTPPPSTLPCHKEGKEGENCIAIAIAIAVAVVVRGPCQKR